MRRTIACVSTCVVLLTACIDSDLQVAEPGPRDRGPAAAERTDVGETVTTAEGNLVTVRRVSEPAVVRGRDLRLLDAEVEVCASDGGDGATAAPEFFRALVAEGYRRPASPGTSPALTATRLRAGQCVRGWVGFPVRPTEEPEAIVLLASSVVEWTLT